jgi:hypothetical protein
MGFRAFFLSSTKLLGYHFGKINLDRTLSTGITVPDECYCDDTPFLFHEIRFFFFS